jgi:multiple sugar transport system permease protein
MQRRSTIAFLMTLPLFVLILALVAYPAGYAVWLSMLNRRTTEFIGLGNFQFLLGRERFWMVVWQTSLFAVTAVLLKAVIGFAAAHLLNTLPVKGQRKWRGMLLLPWVIPPAMGTLGWRLLVDPSFSPTASNQLGHGS